MSDCKHCNGTGKEPEAKRPRKKCKPDDHDASWPYCTDERERNGHSVMRCRTCYEKLEQVLHKDRIEYLELGYD